MTAGPVPQVRKPRSREGEVLVQGFSAATGEGQVLRPRGPGLKFMLLVHARPLRLLHPEP